LRDTGEEVQILKQDDRKKFVERLGPGGSIYIYMSAKILNPNDDVCKKLWRDEGGKPRY